jgi:hypothetical protein
VAKKHEWGWHPREDSWEEAVFTWHEQVERTFRRRRSGAEQEALAEAPRDEYAERDEPDAPSRVLGPEVREPHR